MAVRPRQPAVLPGRGSGAAAIAWLAAVFCASALAASAGSGSPGTIEGRSATVAPAAGAGEAGRERGSARPAEPSADGTSGAAETPVFHIQLWDAHKTGWTDPALSDLAAAGFTIAQTGWYGGTFPSRATLNRIASHGLLFGGYINTVLSFRSEALAGERVRVRYATVAGDRPHSVELHPFDPVYHEFAKRMARRRFDLAGGSAGIYKVMVNSERNAPLSYDDLTAEAATAAGAMEGGQEMPTYDRGVWSRAADRAKSDLADPVAFRRWLDSEGGDNPVNRAVAAAVREHAPGVLVTTDPLSDMYCYGQYRGMDVLQDWVRVHQAPRDPLSIAYRTERLKAHLRREPLCLSGAPRQIWIGPQLGTSTRLGARYAAPADLIEEALWLAVAFGARGITCWGYDTVRRSEALDAAAWGRIRRFRDELLGRYPHLLDAVDAPRRCAVLLSKANYVLTSRRYYEVDENYENFFRVLLTAHVQADVLYDEDVLEGALSRYSVLLLPGIEHLTGELEAAIERFAGSGGRVVRHEVFLPPYRDYDITAGKAREEAVAGATLFPHQYRAWRHRQAARLLEAIGADASPGVAVDNMDVIMNLVVSRGRRYAVLVNDSRSYGAWTRSRGHRVSEDAGVGAEATLVVEGEPPRRIRVLIPAAGIAVIEY